MEEIFENTWRSIYNAYLIPEAYPTFCDFSKTDAQVISNNNEEDPFFEYESEVCDFKLKSEIEDCNNICNSALDDLFYQLENQSSQIEMPPPQYFPVQINGINIPKSENKNHARHAEGKSTNGEIKARSVSSRVMSNKELHEMKMEEEKRKRREEKLELIKNMTEEEREALIEKKERARKALAQTRAKHEREEIRQRKEEDERNRDLEKKKAEKEEKMQKYKRTLKERAGSPRRVLRRDVYN